MTHLEIHPNFFGDFALQMAGDLVNRRLIDLEDLDKVQVLIEHRLAFQLNLQEGWKEGDEETSVRMRMDRV